jgi:hypothetical protein
MNNTSRQRKPRARTCAIVSLAMMLVLVLLAGGPLLAARAQAANAPEFLDSFAVSTVWPGQNWQIFVKGADPNGQMDHIWVVVSQLGGNMWSNHVIPLKGDERKSFSGYINLPIPNFIRHTGWEYLEIEMKIRDTSGNYSQKRVQELTIGSPTKESIPAEWRSAENHQLGTIFFDFDLDHDGGAGGGDHR